MKAFLGIDTSCYTTSVALCCAPGSAAEGPFFQQRKPLVVPLGERGLMQSEAVFQHIVNLPGLLEALLGEHRDVSIAAVCASTRPRPVESSYMPVFRAGESVAKSIALSLGVPFYPTTHQQGHLRAAFVGTALSPSAPVLAVHLSGGTTELLGVQGDHIELLGGTLDLHAGQLIDRIGVLMGLAFPAGPALEQLALRGSAQSRLNASIRGLSCHFSGAQTQAEAWLQSGALSREDIAAEVFSCVARTIARLIVAGCAQSGHTDVLLGGGVASSRLIRMDITQRVAKRNHGISLHFAQPALAGDNAVGVSLIGMEAYERA